MKTWKITINAKDEKQALEMLNCLKESFQLALLVNKPMNHAFLQIGEKEILKCERI